MSGDREVLAHRIAGGIAFIPAVRAVDAAMEELQLTYTAKNPVQGEASYKVLAYRAAVATVLALLEAGADLSAVSDV